MYYVYILKSIKGNHYHTGQTPDLRLRISYHNRGLVNSTRRYKPWKIHYFEKFRTKGEALKREKYLKSHAGRNWLKSIKRA